MGQNVTRSTSGRGKEIGGGAGKMRKRKHGRELMDRGMMGPDWACRILAYLAGIGAAAVITGVVCGISWLIRHVRVS